MILKETKFDFNDITIVPTITSEISSRKEVDIYDLNNMLPLFTAPMDTVISIDNLELFEKNKIIPIIPRTSKINLIEDDYFGSYEENWLAVGLTEFEELLENKRTSLDPIKILIDIANGHMLKLLNLIKKAKSIYGENIQLMVGNVANPETYKTLSEAGADYVRCGIGGGSACLTSQNVAVNYPLASLIHECYEISCTLDKPAKIVADGGMKNYSDIIKALGLGADYVMLGSILNKALESSGETLNELNQVVDQYSERIKNAFKNETKFYKKFRGMSTKEVQKLLGNEKLKTSEGVNRVNQVEYTLEGWVENFSEYLASAMSYSGAKNLNEFIGKANFVKITQNSFNRFNK